MKFLFLFPVFCVGLFSASAQQPFVCTEPGTVLEYACYDAEGRPTGYSRSTVERCGTNADGWLEVVSREEMLGLSREPLVKEHGPDAMLARTIVRAEDTVVPLGDLLVSVLRDERMSVAMTEGGDYAYPFALSVGMTLPDVVSVFNVRRDGEPTKMNIRLTVGDRAVLAHERIAVPAGTFEAYKVSETVSVKLLVFRVAVKNVSWFVPGLGAVRTEQQTEKGKIENYSELLSIRKPDVR